MKTLELEDVNAIMELVPEDRKTLDVHKPEGEGGESYLEMGGFLLAFANATAQYLEKNNESV